MLDASLLMVNVRTNSFTVVYQMNETPSALTIFYDSSQATDSVVPQVYRHGSADARETVSSYSTAGCSTANYNLTAEPSGTISEYFEQDGSNYWIFYRVYQVESTSAIKFKLDSFRADLAQPNLRHGGVFREEGLDPFSWQAL